MRYCWLDFETFTIEPALLAPPVVVGSYAWDDGPVCVQHANPLCVDPALPPLDETLLAALQPGVVIVAHNAPFEVAVMLARRPEWTGLLFPKLRAGEIRCTMGREKLIRVARGDRKEGFALDDCCEAYRLPAPDKENPWRVRFGELWSVRLADFPPSARDYSAGDICVRELYWKQDALPPAWLVDQHHQMRAAVALHLTSCRGFETDPDAAATLLEETEAKLAEYQAIVLEAGLARWEKKKGVQAVVKTKAAAEARLVAAYAAQGREPPRGDPTDNMIDAWRAENQEEASTMTQREIAEVVPGNISLDAEACENSGDPLLLAYTRFSQASTLRSKVRRLGHSPIQTRYNVLVATGRTSSSQGDDPKPGQAWTSYGMQTQNLPRIGARAEEEEHG